ncbi:MAG: VPLPA-CTERM sorting domain-containing protein [Alphaproteobacteria bacterium]|nr:VPLPA-CTERM sorting domain-containing protein [Alphaproteobacteria bacterium]
MAAASRPAAGGKIEIEAADDFVITGQTQITSATFIGVITGAIPTVGEVAVEIYRVFPFDSVIPPSGNVPTRANSPSDVAYDTRDSGLATLSFLTSTLSPNFTAQNSVLNGINKSPNQTTGGEGPVSGMEVQFTVNFVTPFDLATNHYFFIPQVQITGGEFYWLSSVRPIVAPGTPFAPDLQAWTRNANLDPDWLRIGTDIVGGDPPPTFDEAFTLTGQTVAVPEPASLPLLAAGLSALVFARRRKKTA